MAMTGEHSQACRADTTNTFTLSTVDEIYPTPNVVDGNEARSTTTIPNVDDSTSYDRRRSAPLVQRIYANPESEFFSLTAPALVLRRRSQH